MSESEAQRRRRWINLGELIAIAALIVSALGVWITWKGSQTDKPTRVVEQRQPIPLILRGTVEKDGRRLVIAPVEPGHALQSLTISLPAATPIEVGSDGTLDSDALESVLKTDESKGTQRLKARIDTRYVEMGRDKTSSAAYLLRYRWEGGGLLGGRSLRFVSFSRG